MTDIRDAFVGTFFVPEAGSTDGVSPYYVNLSNESHTIVLNADGSFSDEEKERARTFVEAGLGQIPYTYIAGDSPDVNQFAIIDVVVSTIGWTAAERSDGSVGVTNITVGALNGCSVYFNVKFADGSIVSKTFSVDKNINGGAVDLIASKQTITYDGEEVNLFPADIVFTSSLRGTLTPASYKWYSKYDSGAWTEILSNNAAYTIANSILTLKNDSCNGFTELFTTLIIRVEILDSAATVIDNDTVKVEKRKNGTSAYTINLSNEYDSVLTDSNGIAKTGEILIDGRVITYIEVFKNGLQYDYTSSNTNPPAVGKFAITDITPSVNSGGWTATENTSTGSIYIATVGTAESVTFAITILLPDGSSVDKLWSIDRNNRGIVSLASSTDFILYDQSQALLNGTDIVFTATPEGVGANPTYKWYRSLDDGGYSLISGQSAATYTLVLSTFNSRSELFTNKIDVKVEVYANGINTLCDWDSVSVEKRQAPDSGISFSIDPGAGLSWNKDAAGTWSRTTNTTLTVTYYKAFVSSLATRTFLVTFASATGLLSASADAGVNGIVPVVTGSGTKDLTVTFTYSSISVPISLHVTEAGNPGNDAYTVFLTNENHPIPTDKDGNNPVFTGAATSAFVLKGAQNYTYSNANAGPYTFKITNSATVIAGSNCTGSLNTSTGLVSINAITSDTAYLDIEVVIFGGPTVTKRMSLVKNKNASFVEILTSGYFYKYVSSFSGTPSPSSITLTSSESGLTVASRQWAYSADGVSWTNISGATAATLAVAYNNVLWGVNRTMQFRCLVNSVYYDVITLVHITDGSNGTNGTNGVDGPGTVFRGDFAAGSTYYYTAFRRDVVKVAANDYRIYSVATTTAGRVESSWVAGNWTTFSDSFESIATNLLLTGEAIITQKLTFGSGTAVGKLASNGITAELTNGDGIFIEGGTSATAASKVRIGRVANGVLTNGIHFDGTALGITTPLFSLSKSTGHIQIKDAISGNVMFDTASQQLDAKNAYSIVASNLTGVTINSASPPANSADWTGGFYLPGAIGGVQTSGFKYLSFIFHGYTASAIVQGRSHLTIYPLKTPTIAAPETYEWLTGSSLDVFYPGPYALQDGKENFSNGSYISKCFNKHLTYITMHDDTQKLLKDITYGDMVKSYNTQTHLYENSKVVGISESVANSVIDLGNDTEVTYEHPFLTADGFKPINEIYDGEMVFLNGVFSPLNTKIYKTKVTEVITISTDNLHNYIANGYLVHNKSASDNTPVLNPGVYNLDISAFQAGLYKFIINVQFAEFRGHSTWANNISYEGNSNTCNYVLRSGTYYKCVANNYNQDPATTTGYWQNIGDYTVSMKNINLILRNNITYLPATILWTEGYV